MARFRSAGLRGYFSALVVILAMMGPVPGRAEPTIATQEFSMRMDDGVGIYGVVRYAEPMRPRPVAVAVTWYAPTPTSLPPAKQESFDLQDFAVARVHVRGEGASEGLWDWYGPRTKKDSWEIIDFLSKQPWSNGSVLSFGFSGGGVGNFDNAISGHPALKAVIQHSSGFDFYRDLFHPGGAQGGLGRVTPALPQVQYTQNNTLDQVIEARRRVGHRIDTFPEQVAAYEASSAEAQARSLDSSWWRARSTWEEAPSVRIPVLLVTSLRDLWQWQPHLWALQRFPNSWLRLTGGHGGVMRMKQTYAQPSMNRFARHFMLGEDNGFEGEPRVVLPIELGSEQDFANSNFLIRGESAWPLEGTRWTRLYLRTGRTGSAASLNDGALSTSLPATEEPDVLGVGPVPGPHTELNVTNTLAQGDAAFDMRPDEALGLTYTTPAFTRNVEISGPITLRVFARSTAPDFLWVVRVTDVRPDGTSVWMANQVLRASMRRVDEANSVRNADGDIVMPWYSFDATQPLQSGDVEEYLIDAGQTANVFQKGHRLRVDLIGVGSSTEDAPLVPGIVTVYHDAAQPSSILLPVIPSRCQDTPVAFPESTHPGACASSLEEALS